MRFLSSIGATAIVVIIPAYAGFNIQKLVQVPAPEPGQQVAASQTDSQGNLIVVATVVEPVPSGFQLGLQYALVKKIDPNGNQIFSRLLSGVVGFSLPLVVDNNDDIYLGAQTLTPQAFPFTNLLPLFSIGVQSGFVMKLHGSDGTIAYATDLWETPTGIAVDTNGQALIALGSPPTITTTGGAYASPPGSGDFISQTYLVRLSAAGGQLIFVARYGGESPAGEAVTKPAQVLFDGQGNIWIAGNTNATDLSVTSNALGSPCGCNQSGFLAEFSGDGARLLYASYFGSSTPASGGGSQVRSAAIDKGGHIWMVGSTGSGFPVTTNALQKSFTGSGAGFIAEFDPASNQLLYASYFGGALINQVQTGADGAVAFEGVSNSTPLAVPATGFTNGTLLLASIDPQTYAIALTTFPDGSLGTGLAFTPSGSIVVSGSSNILEVVQASTDSSSSAQPSIYGIANAAGGPVTGQIAPTELITIYGANVGPATPVTADLSSGAAPTQLGGVQVFVNGAPIPLLYAQHDQINAILPADFQIPIIVTLSNAGANSNPVILGLNSASPEAFPGSTPSRDLFPFAAALNQDGSVNAPGNAAQPGTIVAVFATGFGLITTATPVQVFLMEGAPQGTPFNNESLEVTYAGQAPDLVTGVTQVNFRLPAALRETAAVLQFDVGGWLSPMFALAVVQ